MLRFLKSRVCGHHNPLRQRGIVFCFLRCVSRNPSLTLRVVINCNAFACFTNQSAETRNFKTYGGGLKAAWQDARGAVAVGGDDEFASGGIQGCVADAADAVFGEQLAV